ncbi:MAG: aminotransferase class I/II-fold pyridoxal phosphate-dependent enzyme [Bacteroidota bacterium]|nr:aminotransferase class I/II-fold pyridoxal phosphate-dependent enzyme [Bacteroidota bacterium]
MLHTAFTCNALKFKQLFSLIAHACSGAGGIERFTKATADYYGIDKERVFLFGSARMGLYSFLKSLKPNPDDEVLVAGYTCVVVTNAIKYAGLKAVYVDIDESNLNINTQALLESINVNTKVVVVTHNFGITYEDIGLIKEKHPEIIIVEDAAHTIGSVDSNGQKAGLLGDAAFVSLEYSKCISTGMGGIFIVNCQLSIVDFRRDYERLPFYPKRISRKIFLTLLAHLSTSHRWTIPFKGIKIGAVRFLGMEFISSPEEIKGEMPSHYPVRLSPGLANIGYLQMKKMQEINKIKDRIIAEYHENLKDIPGIEQYYSQKYNYVRYPLVFRKTIEQPVIDAIKKDLARLGISVGEWFNDVVHPKGSYRYCYTEGHCPVGESVSSRIINLPVNINTTLSEAKLRKVRLIFEKYLTSPAL